MNPAQQQKKGEKRGQRSEIQPHNLERLSILQGENINQQEISQQIHRPVANPFIIVPAPRVNSQRLQSQAAQNGWDFIFSNLKEWNQAMINCQIASSQFIDSTIQFGKKIDGLNRAAEKVNRNQRNMDEEEPNDQDEGEDQNSNRRNNQPAQRRSKRQRRRQNEIQRIYTCPICDIGYGSSSPLKLHCFNKHQIRPELIKCHVEERDGLKVGISLFDIPEEQMAQLRRNALAEINQRDSDNMVE